MKRLSLALLVALAVGATPALAQKASKPFQYDPNAIIDPNAPGFDPSKLPIGLDGAPPSPLCRASRPDRAIHCFHNMVWHGGPWYVDDRPKTTKHAAKKTR